MNAKIVCNWLGLPDQAWPPDHYTLLGLKPGDGDLAHIERQVQECMSRLRCYQLSYPEEATAGMNLVAQAFISLMEIHSKKNCQQGAPGKAGSPADRNGQEQKTGADPNAETSVGVGAATTVDWNSAPPPVRLAKAKSDPAIASLASAAPVPTPAAATPTPQTAPPPAAPPAAASAAPVPPPAASIDPIIEIAQHSPEARRGLTTLAALIERINLTRRLLIAWKHAGRYLGFPKKKLTRQAEETDLVRRLTRVFELTADFPGIVGQPGKPGYRVVAMARLAMTAQMFKVLDETQRKALAQDWNAAYKVLLAHRQFLRRQFKSLRRQSAARKFLQAVRGAINDHPLRVLVVLLLIAAACAMVYWYMF